MKLTQSILVAATCAISVFGGTAHAQMNFAQDAQSGGQKSELNGSPKSSQRWGTTQTTARMIFLNGTNINGVRNQELSNVSIRIDEAGNFHISAPQYEVQQDSSYHPLMPSELPRFPKRQTGPVDLPQGKFSKETGLPSSYLPGGAQPTQQSQISSSENRQESSYSGSTSVEDLPPEKLNPKTVENNNSTLSNSGTQVLSPDAETRTTMIPPSPFRTVGSTSTRTAEASAQSDSATAAKAKPAQNGPKLPLSKQETPVVPPPELPPEAQGSSM